MINTGKITNAFIKLLWRLQTARCMGRIGPGI